MDLFVFLERHADTGMNGHGHYQLQEFDFRSQLSVCQSSGPMLYSDAGGLIVAPEPIASPMTHYFDNLPSTLEVWYPNGNLHPPVHAVPHLTTPGVYNSYPASPSYPPHLDSEDRESQSSGTRSHSVVNPDELPSPTTLSQPYYQQHLQWNTASYAPSLSSVQTQIAPVQGCFVVPTHIEHEQVRVPVAADVSYESDNDETVSDADAEGEDDPSITGADEPVLMWSVLHDQPTPESLESNTGPSSEDDVESDNGSVYQPTQTRRKSSSGKQSVTTTRSGRNSRRPQMLSASSKISDRTSASRGRLTKTKISYWTKKGAAGDAATRPFYCPLAPYGCSSTFPNKNEWKRHTSTQHVKQGYWRCRLCPGEHSNPPVPYNDFNRKDLFVQHVQRMHRDHLELDMSSIPIDLKAQLMNETLEEDSKKDKKFHKGTDRAKQEYWIRSTDLQGLDAECWVQLRELPQTCVCPVCNTTKFNGSNAWEERMEHMAGHFDHVRRGSGNSASLKHSPKQWKEDENLCRYFEDEGLIQRDTAGEWRIGKGVPIRLL